MKQTLRGYELREKIGEGGFGIVYRAYQPVLEREVAIKVILPKHANQPDFIRNFETEAQVVAHLEHPHIVPLYDYWRDPDGAYLVMRWFQGNLRQLLNEQGALPISIVLKFLEQIATALHAAHRKQVIHRDLKPDNILLDDEANAYLTDFGIARIAGKDPSTQSVSGTVAYTSPEQLQSRTPTAQMDIYSLGIVLYEMLTGSHPYAGLSPIELVYQHMTEPIPDIHKVLAEYPARLNNVLQKATAKDATKRYQTTLELLHDFHAVFTPEHIPPITALTNEPVANPYKGLRAFTVADTSDFFGRENLVITMLERLRSDERFLAVVGPSGSGKSSVVKAGLIAALRDETISDKWFIAECVPGLNPLHNLAEALASISPVTLTNAEEQLASNERGLIWLVNMILADSTGEIALVIDQFEEVFTLADEQQRNPFLALLTTAIHDVECRLRIILTLRADFYDRPLLFEGFGQLVQDHTQVVLPLSAEELERAITSPAEKAGVEVEGELVAAMVSDVREEPGALPLLQYALTELFEQRTDHKMTLAAYRASGGIQGILAQRADEIYQTLSEAQKLIARQIFLRLVTLGEGTEDTRRRVQRAELQQIIPNKTALNTVLDAFGTARLLTFDVESSTREPIIEVAHEALIREWRQLREWLSDSRNDVRLQRLLATAASEWRESQHDTSYLLLGSRLTQFEEWARTSSVLLAPDENTYLEKSIDAQEAEFDARQRTQLERQRLQAQVHTRQQQVIFALAFGVVLALILTVVAFVQANTARREANANATAQMLAVDAQTTSEYRADIANSQRLALRAERVEENGQSDVALALAIEANRLQNPPPDAIRVLSDLSTFPLVQGYLDGHSEPATALAFTPDGQYVLSGACANRRGSRCSGGELLLWNIATNTVTQRLEGHTSSISAVAVAADGRLALSGANDGSIILWDLQTGEQLRVYEGQIQDTSLKIGFSPDGLRFAVITAAFRFVIREVATGHMIYMSTASSRSSYQSFAFLPDNMNVLVGGCVSDRPEATGCQIEDEQKHGVIIQLNTLTGKIVQELTIPQTMNFISAVAFSPQSQQIIATSVRHVGVWDIGNTQIKFLAQLVTEFSDELSSWNKASIGISADGTTITVIRFNGSSSQFNTNTGTLIRNFIAPDGVTSVTNIAISSDGQHLAMSLLDNRIMLVAYNSVDQLFDWVLEHRTLFPLSCDERVTYSVYPLCDADGNIPPTPTPYPTITPYPTVTMPVWTPIPSPTAIDG